MQFNIVDIAILIVIGFSAVGGLRRGFLLSVVDLVGLGLALVVAIRASGTIAAPLAAWGLPDQLAAALGFVVAASIALAVIGLASKILLAPLAHIAAGTPLGWLNSLLGLAPGVLRGLILAALALSLLETIPEVTSLHDSIAGSRLAGPVTRSGQEILRRGLAWAGVTSGQPDAFPLLSDR
jgi:membrane protein required for colicin V production